MLFILFIFSLVSLVYGGDDVWTETYTKSLVQCRRCLDTKHVQMMDQYFNHLNDTVQYNLLYAHALSRLGHGISTRQIKFCDAFHAAMIEMMQVHQYMMTLIENNKREFGWPETLEHMKKLNVNITSDCLLIKSSLDIGDVRYCMGQLRKNAMKKLIIEQTQL